MVSRGKTQNVVDVFASRLFVVVMFHAGPCAILFGCQAIPGSTLKHPRDGEQSTFPQLVQNFGGRDFFSGG
jgi:hypothetical protein